MTHFRTRTAVATLAAGLLGLAPFAAAPSAQAGTSDAGERPTAGTDPRLAAVLAHRRADASASGLSPQTGMTSGTDCTPVADFFTPDRTHTIVATDGSYAPDAYPTVAWSFTPRALAFYKSVTTSTTSTLYYYAIDADGVLWRVGETTGLSSGGVSVAYVQVGTGWSTTKDITVRDTRFYYVTATGEMRRRTIQVGGLLSPSVLLRSGLTSTIQLSNAGQSYWTDSSGSTSTYDDILAITREGGLQLHRYRYSGTAYYSTTLTTLKTSGWNRFNSVDVAWCGSTGLRLMGRDYTTKEALMYTEPDVFDGTGADLRYEGKPGSILYPTFGA